MASSKLYIELCINTYRAWLNGALLKENLFCDPRFLFFFLNGTIIVHEIKSILKILNIRFFKVVSNKRQEMCALCALGC